MKDKPYNNGTWTPARFNSFVKGGLRSLSNRWGPKFSVLKKARVERGLYRCAGYGVRSHVVPVTTKQGDKRVRNISVDHIQPVVSNGDRSWDTIIARMFCEIDGLQVLCSDCHKKKTADERAKHVEK